MGYKDQEGNWIEDFKSRPYDSEQEAKSKIKAVYQAYVIESGWVLNGEPRIEKVDGKFVAIIPLKKPRQDEFDRPKHV